jgi:hypothetical protein
MDQLSLDDAEPGKAALRRRIARLEDENLRLRAQLARIEEAATQARARRTDPGTSHAAARSVNTTANHLAVLVVFRRCGPMTDEQLVANYGIQRRIQEDGVRQSGDLGRIALPQQAASGLRTRRKELVDRGLVRDTGRKAPMSTGRDATVWEAVA